MKEVVKSKALADIFIPGPNNYFENSQPVTSISYQCLHFVQQHRTDHEVRSVVTVVNVVHCHVAFL